MFNFLSKVWEWFGHWLWGEPPDHQQVLELQRLFDNAVTELAQEHSIDLYDPRVQRNMHHDQIFDLLVAQIEAREIKLSTDPIIRSKEVRAYVARRVFSAQNIASMRERSA